MLLSVAGENNYRQSNRRRIFRHIASPAFACCWTTIRIQGRICRLTCRRYRGSSANGYSGPHDPENLPPALGAGGKRWMAKAAGSRRPGANVSGVYSRRHRVPSSSRDSATRSVPERSLLSRATQAENGQLSTLLGSARAQYPHRAPSRVDSGDGITCEPFRCLEG
jgi:hypothetical protein